MLTLEIKIWITPYLNGLIKRKLRNWDNLISKLNLKSFIKM